MLTPYEKIKKFQPHRFSQLWRGVSNFALVVGCFFIMKSGIYKIHFGKQKCYIGSSVELERRIIVHKSLLKRQTHENVYLQRAYNKYGVKKMKIEVLEHCEVSVLLEREQFYIDLLNGTTYNICKTAGNCLGVKHTDETKARKSVIFSGERNPFYGKKHTKKTLKKLSKTLKTIKGTDAARKLNSMVHIGLQVGSKNGMSKKVIDTSTGHIYSCAREASEYLNISAKSLRKQLVGYNKNKTTLKYLC